MKKQANITEAIENFARTLLEVSNPRPMMEDFDKAVKIAMQSFSAMGRDIAGIDGEQIKRKLQTEIVFTIKSN